MARMLWKGAIAFGLVNIPVELYPGSRSSTIDLDWIDKRDMAPVGIQRINKKTGKPVGKDDVVKGYQYSKGNYVILADADLKAANPKATQTIEILAFVDRDAIPPQYFETSYRLAPGKHGEKAYALLREALRERGKVGVAQVVIRVRQHLAAVMIDGDMLRLEILRYADEVLDASELRLPASGKRAGLNDKELTLARRLVDDMSGPFTPEEYRDTYREDLLALVEKKVKSGKTETVSKAPKAPAEGAQVIDLVAALKRSLEGQAAERSPKRASAEAKSKPRAAARKRA